DVVGRPGHGHVVGAGERRTGGQRGAHALRAVPGGGERAVEGVVQGGDGQGDLTGVGDGDGVGQVGTGGGPEGITDGGVVGAVDLLVQGDAVGLGGVGEGHRLAGGVDDHGGRAAVRRCTVDGAGRRPERSGRRLGHHALGPEGNVLDGLRRAVGEGEGCVVGRAGAVDGEVERVTGLAAGDRLGYGERPAVGDVDRDGGDQVLQLGVLLL